MSDDTSAPAKDRETGRFLTGNNGGGRPKGSRNKLSEAFIAALQTDFEAYGAAVIQRVRAERADVYLKVVASLVPKQLEIDASPLSQFNVEQLAQLLGAIDAFLAQSGGDGDATSIGRNAAGAVQTVQ